MGIIPRDTPFLPREWITAGVRKRRCYNGVVRDELLVHETTRRERLFIYVPMSLGKTMGFVIGAEISSFIYVILFSA